VKLLVTGSSIRGLPVVSIAEGEDVAEVRDIIYHAEAGAVVGFTLNKRGMLAGRLKQGLPIEQVHAVGRDAVMIDDGSQLVAPEDAPEAVGSPETERDVIGNDVLTESGVSLGTVTDVVVYQIKLPGGGEGYIPLPVQLAVSGAALVVPDVTRDFVCNDLVGLGAAVDEFRARLGIA
jgi:sporulation protein YlmC with PRC-barrel domain